MVDKIWYVLTMEYYSAFKKKDILPYVTAWMNVIDFTLNKRKLAEKITCALCVVPFILRTETTDKT